MELFTSVGLNNHFNISQQEYEEYTNKIASNISDGDTYNDIEVIVLETVQPAIKRYMKENDLEEEYNLYKNDDLDDDELESDFHDFEWDLYNYFVSFLEETHGISLNSNEEFHTLNSYMQEGFDRLKEIAKENDYKITKSPYSDSFYAIPEGTSVSWDSKPLNSYRLSDHWNFYSYDKRHCVLEGTNPNEYFEGVIIAKYNQNGHYDISEIVDLETDIEDQYNSALRYYCDDVSKWYNDEIKFYEEELSYYDENSNDYQQLKSSYEEFKQFFKNGEVLFPYELEDYCEYCYSSNGEYPDIYNKTQNDRDILDNVDTSKFSLLCHCHFDDYTFDINTKQEEMEM